MEDFNLSAVFPDSQLADIVLMRAQGLEWEELQKKFNKKYPGTKTLDSLKHAYRKYGNFFETDDNTVKVKHLQEIQRVKRSNSKTAKENKMILDFLNEKEEILENIKEIVKKAKKNPVKFKKSKAAGKKNMTMELMLSDLHYGKKTKTFNLEVCRRRIIECRDVLISEIERASILYNVHRLIMAFLGDIIESETMHGLESARGCEFGNAKQVQAAIESLFIDLLLPVGQECARRGIEIDCPMVAGNHDRSDTDKTFNDPGSNYWTWVIYNTLKLLCEQVGLKNVKFNIPEGSHAYLDIYGNTVLYEHLDNTKACTKKALEDLLNNRQTQLKKIISFLRGGHYHEFNMFGRGRIIVNESLPGPDSYSDINGYDSQAGQTLNQYVETDERPTCFYRSFPIYLT